jgi:hypothetical protein
MKTPDTVPILRKHFADGQPQRLAHAAHQSEAAAAPQAAQASKRRLRAIGPGSS